MQHLTPRSFAPTLLRRFVTLSILSSLFISGVSFADQCELIDAEPAAKALDYLKPNGQIVRFCEPCDDKDFYKQPVESITQLTLAQERSGGQTYWSLSVNGKGIDLAYTFVRTPTGEFLNLSKLAACPSSDVSVGFPAQK